MSCSENTAEANRLKEQKKGQNPWRKWGSYLSEREWGTVREDYSADGEPWDYFPHDHARSRAYRWGEDGIAGICDDQQHLCFALSLWNGNDPILKERLFGLSNSQGNHGEEGNIKNNIRVETDVANGPEAVEKQIAKLAAQLIDQVIEALASGLTGLTNALNPELIILGGGVIEHLPDSIPLIEKKVKQRALEAATESLKVVTTRLHDDSGVIGAAAFVLQDKFKSGG